VLGHLEGVDESPEHGLAAWGTGWMLSEAGDLDGARTAFDQALDVGRRTDDEGVQGLALLELGHLALADGRREEGLALLDKAAAMAMRGTVAPVHVGFIFCSTIWACRASADWRRATEWAEVSTRWCERESLAGYVGLCRFHRAEISRLHGRLDEAEGEVRTACDELLVQNRSGAAWAFNELGEVLLRRGDLAGSEEAFGRAMELGSDAQPGLARLQLAQGKAEAALRALSRSLDDTALLARENRHFLLPVHVTAAIAAGDLVAARNSVAELAKFAELLDTDAPKAALSVARGELALADHVADEAVSHLRDGVRRWCLLDAPYEAGEARVRLAMAYEAERDAEAARLELLAARSAFTEIGAARDAAHVASLLDKPLPDQGVSASRTFVFTDIVGSTKLVDALGDEAWRQLLAWHDRTLREVFQAHSGEEIKHEGDGFFVAFGDPDAALGCACAIQSALDRHRRAHGFAPHVRIGVHAGVATWRGGDYIGRVVHETARIVDAAAAGEILASTATLSGCTHPLRTHNHRTLELRGLSDPAEIATVDWT
jgi:class 3 adenylate cyclase/predicted negative regulator of RcsB-dependent stress response